MKIDKKIELLQEKLRKGFISYEQYQQELDELFGNVSPFFQKLISELSELAQSHIPQKSKETIDQNWYYSRLIEAYQKSIKENSWVNFWERCEWLETPIMDNVLSLENIGDWTLSNIHICLCQSLKQFQEQGLDDSKETRTLHEYYLLTKAEINKRESTPKLPEIDAFLEFRKNKEQYLNQEERFEEARRTGQFCPYCENKNVVSDGHNWKCNSCGKRFRKH